MTLLLLYSAICYLFMLGFLWDISIEHWLDRTLKILALIFAPIVLPFMIGKIVGDED